MGSSSSIAGLTSPGQVSTKDFFTATALSLSICGSVVLAIWMGWRMSAVAGNWQKKTWIDDDRYG
jgi:hypothetical protein